MLVVLTTLGVRAALPKLVQGSNECKAVTLDPTKLATVHVMNGDNKRLEIVSKGKLTKEEIYAGIAAMGCEGQFKEELYGELQEN